MDGFYITVPAMRGRMGARTYYSCLMPLMAVPQFFKFTDWAGISPEEPETHPTVPRPPPLQEITHESRNLCAGLDATTGAGPNH